MNTLLLLSALLGPPVGNPTSTPSVSQWCPGGTCIGNLTLPATGALRYGTTRTVATAPGDGSFRLTNAAGTTGATFLTYTASMSLRNFGDTGYLHLTLGNIVQDGAYNITTNGNAWILNSTVASDVSAYNRTIMAGNAFQGATTAAKQAGGNLGLYGGIGSRKITIVSGANMAGDTLTFTVNGTPTTLTEGVHYACAAVTAAECACAIYTYMAANPISGISVGRNNATCSDAVVFWNPTVASTYAFVVTPSDVTAGTLTQVSGTDGQVLVGDGSASAPGWAFALDTDTGMHRSGANSLAIDTAGIGRLYVTTSAVQADVNLNVKGGTSKGQLIATTGKVESVTFAGGAGDASKTTTDLVDPGEIVRGLVGRVTTAGGTCAKFDASINLGGGAVVFANDIAVAQNTTFTMNSATATGSLGLCYAAGCEVTITGNDAGGGAANCASMVVAITAFKDQLTAPTSN